MEKEKNVFTCSECGEVLPLEELEKEQGNLQLCSDCSEHYFECSDCHELIHEDYLHLVEDNDYYVCDDCADNNYYYCHDCGRLVSNYYYVDDCDYYVCERCRDYDYYYCEMCNHLVSGDNWYGEDSHNNYVCCDCYEENNNGLLGYHCFNDWCEFLGKNEEKAPYLIGKEIELDPLNYGNENVSGVIEIMQNNLNAVAMEDGSLRSSGVEVVTHPESWEYLKEHKQDYENFFNEIENIGYGNDGRCGLHFHVTRPNDNVISRIIVLMESFKSEIKKLSRRKEHQIEEWAKFLTDYNSNQPMKYQSTKYLKEKFINKYHDRYMALNLTNNNTIEFRFFNGANNFEEFWASLQFIHNLMQIALNEKVDINKVKWEFLIYGDELIAQAIKTNTYLVDKYAKDTTDIYEKVITLETNTKNELKKVMNNFIKYVNREINNIELGNQFTDYSEMVEKTANFSNEISRTCNYLSNLVRLYQNIDTREIQDTKFSLELQANRDKYQRYFNKMSQLIENYESEVRLQCA